MLARLEWAKESLYDRVYLSGRIDLLMRLFGSDFHNFFYDSIEYNCEGRDFRD